MCYDRGDGGDDMVTIDAQMTSWKNFSRQARRMGTRGVRFAVSRVMNDLAFGAKRFFPGFLDTRMTIRSPGFVRTHFAVAKGRPRNPAAYTFSRRAKGFSGWTEQQRGGDKRKRFATIKGGRGGSQSKKIRRIARLRAGKEFLNMSDIPGSSTNQQLAKLLVGLRMSGSRGPFIAGGVGRMPWGLWMLGNLNKGDEPGHRSLRLLQAFDAPADTKRWDWAGQGAKKYISQTDLSSHWTAAFNASWKQAR
jgi:hypothetical protein